MRIVLDTNILVRAVPHANSPAREVFVRAVVSPHLLIRSDFLLAELARVLRYDRLRPIHGLDEKGIDDHVANVAANSVAVQLPTESVPSIIPRDPNDDLIVATAVLGGAEVICTLDRHLRHPDVVAYCAERGIRVMTDVELLQRLRAQEGKPADGC